MAIKVLIIDDEREILDSLRRLFELDPRLEVLTTDDPEEALNLITKENIQLVFCDIVMPQMDGLEFLRLAKGINGLIQVVMMSAYSTVERVIQSLELGAADYLMKPFDREEIEEVLEGLIKRLERWKALVVRARSVQDEASGKKKGGEPDVEIKEEENFPPADSERAFELIESWLSSPSDDLPEKLLSWLEEEERQPVREKLLWSLGEVLSRRPEKEILRRMLSSRDPYVRNGAIEIGRKLGVKILPILEELYAEGDKDLRKIVLDIAYFLPAEEVEGLFLRALEDEDPNIRMTAAEYLGERGSLSAVPRLEERLFLEEEPMLLATILESLTNLERSPRSREIIARFREGLDPILAHSFLKYLGAFGGEEDLSWIEEELRAGRLRFNRELVDAVFGILRRNPDLCLSDYLAGLFERAVHTERKPLAIYQILSLLYSAFPERALAIARELLESEEEEKRIAAENFLSEIEGRNDEGERNSL